MKKGSGHFSAVTGATLQVAIPAGVVGAQLRISSAQAKLSFDRLDDVGKVMKTLNVSIGEMHTAFEPVLWGIGVAFIGIIMFVVAITRLRYRREWAFWFACVYGGCLILLFPVGTPFGVFLLIYALTRRQEFLPVSTTLATST